MKALVLNGSETEGSIVNKVSDYLVDFLRIDNNDVDVMVLRNENIGPCLGCFGCWLRTPGKCVVKDAGYDLPKKVIQSDVLFLLTPVNFGMYSSELKKAMDRYACPLLLPFFAKIDGEIHHAKRYDKYPRIIAIGVLPRQDEACENSFAKLVARNGINLHTATTSRFVYSTDKPDIVRKKVFSTLKEVGLQ
ncbi:MAG TPA: flavodoxin family protein [Candidatus Acidoferrum sp.]|jgi:multimeric flavodoxin WrbA|nr:flavodoxin family protein [Candidatus Acidoferrum sp.]